MSSEVIVIGAGGHARVVADIIQHVGDIVLGFLDDNIEGMVMGLPVLGKIADALNYDNRTLFVIGIGNNFTRKRIAQQYHLNWYTAIHPTAVVASNVIIEKGTVLMAGAIINTGAHIGKHCIINTSTVVEHDNNIADYVHISPHATLCGTVSVGNLSHVGAGVTIRNNIIITSNCVIGAGAVVVKDIKESGTYVGIPAKKVRNS